MADLNNAKVKLQAGDRAGAIAAYEEVLAIDRELAQDKDNPQAQRDLSASLERIADTKFQASDLQGSLAAYEERLAIASQLYSTAATPDANRSYSAR